jgi:predicted RNase H-like HicB family nuclease
VTEPKPKYAAQYQPYTEGYWVARVVVGPRDSAVTQGSTLEETRERIREALAGLLDVSADSFDLVDEVLSERSDKDDE